MPSTARHFYEFGPFRLDPERHRLLRHDQPLPVSPKAFETLLLLVENSGKVLAREELLKKVWAGAYIEDANLTVAISNLRKALAIEDEQTEYIETIPRIGYRFLVNVRLIEEDLPPLIVEKHTVSRTIIEEEVAEDPLVVTPRVRRRWSLALTIIAVVLLASAGLFYFRVRGHNRVFAANTLEFPIRSLAVLPPKSLTPQGDNSSVSLGLTDALVTRLGGIRNLTVRPTSSSIRYLNSQQDPIEVGRALGVDAVLEGSLQREDGRVRITLRMLNVTDGRQLWAGKFDETDRDIFKLQDSVSREVATQLFGELSVPERQQVTRHQTHNAQAYAAYVTGKYFWSRRGDQVVNAIPYYRKAIELDPDFAEAYVGLATIYACSSVPSPEAEALLDHALRLNSSLAEAHATSGLIQMFHHWNWSAAEKELDLAIELDPNSVSAHHWKGVYFSLQGQLDKAKAEMHQALLLDPTSPIILSDIGQLHYFAREYDQAIDYCNQALTLDSQAQVTYSYLFDIYRAKGMEHEAISALLKSESLAGVHYDAERTNALIAHGLDSLLRDRISQYLKLKPEGQLTMSITLARHYLQLKNFDQAMFWLERVTQRPNFSVAYLAIDPIFDPLRSNPRFKAVMKSLNLGS